MKKTKLMKKKNFIVFFVITMLVFTPSAYTFGILGRLKPSIPPIIIPPPPPPPPPPKISEVKKELERLDPITPKVVEKVTPPKVAEKVELTEKRVGEINSFLSGSAMNGVDTVEKATVEALKGNIISPDVLLDDVYIGSLTKQLYITGSDRVKKMNKANLPVLLPQELIVILAPHFPNVPLDKVRVTWNAKLLSDSGNTLIQLFNKNKKYDGQTFGFDVYIASPAPKNCNLKNMDADDLKAVSVLIHELVHVEQFVKYGGKLETFGDKYIRGFFDADRIYENNPLEKEAYEKAKVVKQSLKI